MYINLETALLTLLTIALYMLVIYYIYTNYNAMPASYVTSADLTPAQSKEYLASVEEFRQRWITSNRQANTTNLYDDPKTNDGPSAAFDIINKVRHGKK